MSFLSSLPVYWQVVICLLLLIAIDTALAIVKSMVAGTFKLHALPKFLETAIPTNQLIAFVITVVTDAVQPNGTISSTAMTSAVLAGGGALALKLVADIISKLTPPSKPAE